jgi:phosphopantothenoylcysteine synthetase/decarboxylase
MLCIPKQKWRTTSGKFKLALFSTAAHLAQLVEDQSFMQEVVVQFPAGPTLRVLK